MTPKSIQGKKKTNQTFVFGTSNPNSNKFNYSLIFGTPNSLIKFGDVWRNPRFWHTEFVSLEHQIAGFDAPSYKSIQYFPVKKRGEGGGGLAFQNIQFGVPKHPV